MEIEERLAQKGIVLPPATRPEGSYISIARVGNCLYTSGVSCFKDGVPVYQGRLGEDLTVEEGYDAWKVDGSKYYQQFFKKNWFLK